MTLNKLDLLTAREELMQDITYIVEDHFKEFGITNNSDLVSILCDAVCKNFPIGKLH